MVLSLRLFALATALLLAAWSFSSVQAQVTFSRDWNPGKRMIENQEFHGAVKSASAICRLLIDQIRQLAACENRSDDLDSAANRILGGRP